MKNFKFYFCELDKSININFILYEDATYSSCMSKENIEILKEYVCE